MNEFFYIICYPRGDMSRLAIAAIQHNMSYEKYDYRLASRHNYNERETAIATAKQLAHQNGLIFEGDGPEDNFLD